MGFFSWFSSCGTVDDDGPPSLIRYNDTGEDSDVKRAAAEDVARVEQDDKYFGGGDPSED
jgi:hypothetical protein